MGSTFTIDSDCRQIAFSAGSACGSGTGAPSRVLSAIGLEAKEARNSIRLGFGRYTTREEVETACHAIEAAAKVQGV
jgi:cysteine desulfurase